MSYGSDYDRAKGQGHDHSAARARAQQDQAQRDAEQRKREDQARQAAATSKGADQNTHSKHAPPYSPTVVSKNSSTPSTGTPSNERPVVAYPTSPMPPFGRHPDLYSLVVDTRPHPYTGETVLEIEWHDRLPESREFIPVSALSRRWRTIRSQGIDLPLQVQQFHKGALIRWLAPPKKLPPPVTDATRKPTKVMIGLYGADKKPTYRIR